jgi:hypothetical protein
MGPLAFLGLPSLHDIVEAIAKGFFQTLAHALVPSWLTHGTLATIQYLVALPDPASWTHVSELQGDMVYLGATLLPATLAVGTVRYWLVGLTGAAHPITAVSRSVWAALALVAYKWLVEQVVAMANTLSHAVLGLPVVSEGLRRIVGVLFGGALLGGLGGVFGAFLVIVGVLLAAALFATQVVLTVVLTALMVAGPPLIALTPVPELAHMARMWAHALLAVALVPVGWTLLFAVAGALCLDATSFTGGASGGVPGHVAAAFAGLATFAVAIKLALMVLGELRHLLSAGSLGAGGGQASGQSAMPGAERVRSAHARLRSAVFEGMPSLGASAGAATGALGAPAGGAIGAARRRLTGTRVSSSPSPVRAVGGQQGKRTPESVRKTLRASARERVAGAAAIIAGAPRQARAAMSTGSPARRRGHAGAAAAAPRKAAGAAARNAPSGPRPSTGKPRADPSPPRASTSSRPSSVTVRSTSSAPAQGLSQATGKAGAQKPRASAQTPPTPKADASRAQRQGKPSDKTRSPQPPRPDRSQTPPVSPERAQRADRRPRRREPRRRSGQ